MLIDDLVRVVPPRQAGDYVRLNFYDGTGPFLGGMYGEDPRPFLLLNQEEVEELIAELQDSIDPERYTTYVQVQVSGASPTYPWTYIDPSGDLQVGDRVLVPFGYDNAERVAKVTALGKGQVPGHVTIKSVAARLDVEELTA